MNRGSEIPLGRLDEAVSRFEAKLPLERWPASYTPPKPRPFDFNEQFAEFRSRRSALMYRRQLQQDDTAFWSNMANFFSKAASVGVTAAGAVAGMVLPVPVTVAAAATVAAATEVINYGPGALNDAFQKKLADADKQALKLIDSEARRDIDAMLKTFGDEKPTQEQWSNVHRKMSENLKDDPDAQAYLNLSFSRYRQEYETPSAPSSSAPQAPTPTKTPAEKRQALRNYSQAAKDTAKFIKEGITKKPSEDLSVEQRTEMQKDPYLQALVAHMQRKEAEEKKAEAQREVQQNFSDVAMAGSAVAMLGAVTKDPMLQKAGTVVNVGAGVMQNMALLAVGGLAAGPVIGVAMGVMSLMQLTDDAGPSESEMIKGYIDDLQRDMNKKHEEIKTKLGDIERKVDVIDEKLDTLQVTLIGGFVHLEESLAHSTETILGALDASEKALQAAMAQHTERLYQDIMQASTTIIDAVRRQHDQTRLAMSDRFTALEQQLSLTHITMIQHFNKLHLDDLKKMHYSAVASDNLNDEQFQTLFVRTGNLLYWADHNASEPLFTGGWLTPKTRGATAMIDEADSVRNIMKSQSPLQLLGFVQNDLALRHASHKQSVKARKCEELKIVNLDMWLMASHAYLEGRVKGMAYQKPSDAKYIRQKEIPKMIKGAEETLRFIKHVQSEGILMVLSDYFAKLDDIQNYLIENSRATKPATSKQLMDDRAKFKDLLNALDRTQLMVELYLEIANLNQRLFDQVRQSEQGKAKSYFDRCRAYTLPKDASDDTGRYHRIFLKDQAQSQYWPQALPSLITSKEILDLIQRTEKLAPEALYDVLTTQLQEGRHSHALISRSPESFTRVYSYPVDENSPYRFTLRGRAELYAQALEQSIFRQQFDANPLFSEVQLAISLLQELPDYLDLRLREQKEPEPKSWWHRYLFLVVPLVYLNTNQSYRSPASPSSQSSGSGASAHTQIRLLHTVSHTSGYPRIRAQHFSTTSRAFSNPAMLNVRKTAELGRGVLRMMKP